jgi:hypothetical protein
MPPPRTPTKRRLSLARFAVPQTPVTSKKPRTAATPPAHAPYEAASPLTPDVTPKGAHNGAPTTPTSGRFEESPVSLRTSPRAPSSVSTRLKLEALGTTLEPRRGEGCRQEPSKAQASTPTGLGIEEDPKRDVPAPSTPRAQTISQDPRHIWDLAIAPGAPPLASGSDSEGEKIGNPFATPLKLPPRRRSRHGVSNPFHTAPSLKPPRTRARRQVDYASQLELYNGTTGRYTVQELDERQKRIEPKRLQFLPMVERQDGGEPLPPSEVRAEGELKEAIRGKRYLLQNLNGFMIDVQPRNSLGFEMYKDE